MLGRIKLKIFNLIPITAMVLAIFSEETGDRGIKDTDNFITTCGTEFCLNNKEIKFIGVNIADLLSFSHEEMDSTFKQNSQLGIRVIRVYLDNGGGVEGLRERIKDLDYMLGLAEKYKIRLIMTISWWAGIPRFYGMSFFLDERAQKEYKELAGFVVNRYRDNPWIFSWELMNEPEYFYKHFGGKPDFDEILNWIETMAEYIKTLDKKHLVSVGTGGVWQYYIGLHPETLDKNYYVLMHQSKDIDFITLHFYGIRRLKGDRNRVEVLLKEMVNDGHGLGKPVVLEEFGLKRVWGYEKEFWFKFILDTFFSNGGNGAMYWQSRLGTDWQKEFGISSHPDDEVLKEIVSEKAKELEGD